MNTKIRYLYRDGNNYKYPHSIVVAGKVSFEDLRPYLDGGTYFVPEDVQMYHPGDQAEGWPDDDADHPWCELDADGFEETEQEPDFLLPLVELFRDASAMNWPGQNEEPE